MRLELPAPDTTRLEKSPLQLVVCQVRFEDIPSVTDPRLALAIHGRLGGREGPYPILEQLKGEQLEVTLGIGGSPIATQTSPLNGWRLFSQGRDWIVSLLPGSVSLETTAYTIWDGDFNSRLTSLLDAVSEELRPALEQRLGLRYVDLLTEPEVTSPVGWQGWVETKFLGPILHERIGPLMRSAQQQLEIETGGEARCTLRHGVFPDRSTANRTNYLLDWDVYRDQAKPFDVADIERAATSFNSLALQLFQQAITPEMFSFLKTGR